MLRGRTCFVVIARSSPSTVRKQYVCLAAHPFLSSVFGLRRTTLLVRVYFGETNPVSVSPQLKLVLGIFRPRGNLKASFATLLGTHKKNYTHIFSIFMHIGKKIGAYDTRAAASGGPPRAPGAAPRLRLEGGDLRSEMDCPGSAINLVLLVVIRCCGGEMGDIVDCACTTMLLTLVVLLHR